MTPLALAAPRVPRVQIAGVLDQAEADMLVCCGADALGFPFGLDAHAEDLPEAEAARIIARLPPQVLAVLITYILDPARVLDLAGRLGARGVQLHGRADPAAAAALKAARPDLLVVCSLVVGRDKNPLARARALAPHVDAFLADTFDPASRASGATGQTHDWAVSRLLARGTGRPLILAGGLTPDNVARAVAAVRPFGVDAHTGLEGPEGRKDPRLAAAFVRRARAALGLPGLDADAAFVPQG